MMRYHVRYILEESSNRGGGVGMEGCIVLVSEGRGGGLVLTILRGGSGWVGEYKMHG